MEYYVRNAILHVVTWTRDASDAQPHTVGQNELKLTQHYMSGASQRIFCYRILIVCSLCWSVLFVVRAGKLVLRIRRHCASVVVYRVTLSIAQSKLFSSPQWQRRKQSVRLRRFATATVLIGMLAVVHSASSALRPSRYATS